MIIILTKEGKKLRRKRKRLRKRKRTESTVKLDETICLVNRKGKPVKTGEVETGNGAQKAPTTANSIPVFVQEMADSSVHAQRKGD